MKQAPVISKETQISKTIYFLRFPLMVFIILIHSSLDDIINPLDIQQFKIYHYCSILISGILSQTAVPLFFIISGYLFFNHLQSFSCYIDKLKRRIHSIFYPYIIWNAIVILFYFIAQSLFPTMMSGRIKNISEFNITDYLYAFWNTRLISPEAISTHPICSQFWFLRDLIIMFLLSPILLLIIKSKVRVIFITLLLTLWAINFDTQIVGLNMTSIFFFSLGAYFRVKKISFIDFIESKSLIFIAFYSISIICELYLHNTNALVQYVHKINILIGIITFFSISSKYIKYKDISTKISFLSESSFFLYAYHGIPIIVLKKISVKYIQPDSNFEMIFIYLLTALIIIIIGLLMYYILKKNFPKTTSIITGNRS